MKNEVAPGHLFDGAPVHLVHMRTPKERRRSYRSAADEQYTSPLVDALLLNDIGDRYVFPRHSPFTGEASVVVRLVGGRTVMCLSSRLAHARPCPQCLQTWKDAEFALTRRTPADGLRSTIVSSRNDPSCPADFIMVDALDVGTYGDDLVADLLDAEEFAMYLVTTDEWVKIRDAQELEDQAQGQAATTDLVLAMASAATGRALTGEETVTVRAAVERIDVRRREEAGPHTWFLLDKLVKELSAPIPAGQE